MFAWIFILVGHLLWSAPAEQPSSPPEAWTAGDKLRCNKGQVGFLSKAPLEIIEAESNQLQGIIDPAAGTFAWSVDMKTFQGFNSPLQKEHFNENYVESAIYPKATFTGKIIESIDLSQNGVYTVRAKGKMSIHGVTQERIIKCSLEIKKNSTRVKAAFTVKLADHDITIPKVVYQKITEEIAVTIDAELK